MTDREPQTVAREMLAAEYEAAGYRDEAIAFRAGSWTCHDHPALIALTKALSREEQVRAEERERCARVADLHAEVSRRELEVALGDREISVLDGHLACALDIATAIRDGSPADDGWQDIATAPGDAPFMAGLWVENNQTGERWWETYIISIDDETGEAESWPESDTLPWDLQAFDKWRPLPAAPSLRASGHEGGGNG